MIIYRSKQSRLEAPAGRLVARSSEALHALDALTDDVGEDGGGELLGLEMSGLDDEEIGMTEVVVIADLARQEGIGAEGFCLGDELAAGAGAEGEGAERFCAHSLHIISQPRAAQHLADVAEQLLGRHRLGQLADDAAIGERRDSGQAEARGEVEIEATLGAVEVGVSRIDGDAGADGQHERAADIGTRGVDALDATEQQGMMSHDELATQTLRVEDGLLGDVEARQNAADLQSRIPALKASVIIRFLQRAGSYLLDGRSDVEECGHTMIVYQL